MTTPIRTCTRCGCTADNLIEFHDRPLCPDCYDRNCTRCTRCGSLISLDECWYHDVDEDKQVLCSNGLKNKFRKRAVPITDDALWLRLTQAPRTVTVGNREVPTEYIIHSPEGKAYNPNNWANRVFRPFMQRLHKEHPEIPMLSPHELRHTRATLWIAQGVDPYMVARLLGHSDLKMLTKIYDHTSTETLRKVSLETKPVTEAKKEEL